MAGRGAILTGEDTEDEEESGSEGEVAVAASSAAPALTAATGGAGAAASAGAVSAGQALPKPDAGAGNEEVVAWALASVLRPTLLQLTTRINELQESQLKLIDALQVERAGIASLPHMERINATMAKATLYSAKIARMRKTMDATSAQMAATKKQVSNWQAQFAKDESSAKAKRAKEAELDKALAAKPAASLGSRQASGSGGDDDS